MKYSIKFLYKLDGVSFGYIDGNVIEYASSCKEEYLCYLMARPLSTVDKIVMLGTLNNKNLQILHSFETEFNLPLTEIDEITKDYCVINVNKIWKKNWITLGLLCSLVRASISHKSKSWRNVKRGDIFDLQNCSTQKIKALWWKEFDTMASLGAYYDNWSFYLFDFDCELFFSGIKRYNRKQHKIDEKFRKKLTKFQNL